MLRLRRPIKLAVHGGVDLTEYSAKEMSHYHQALQDAITAAADKLCAGDSSLNAVQIAVEFLENSPLFNAGYGSALTATGSISLDASIMDGDTLQAGSVTGVSRLANPIAFTRLLLQDKKNLMLAGQAAEEYAQANGFTLINPNKLITTEQNEKWQQRHEKRVTDNNKYGTVGAVALDRDKRLAAATSTGGLFNKNPGRVGDSCILGAGTFANQDCAVSTTGQGEYFMRLLTAHDIAALLGYKKYSLKRSVKLCMKKISRLGGLGGILALDSHGNIVIQHNTKRMYSGYFDGKKIQTEIE